MDQRISFVETRFGEIAYATVGSGPVLLCDLGWLGHLGASWEAPPVRRFFERLGEEFTVVRYDKLGTGLSGRERRDLSSAPDLEALEAVAGQLGEEPISVFGMCAPVGAIFAARHPDRVRRLVMYATYPRGSDVGSPPMRESLAGLMRAHWGLGARTLADIFVVDEDPEGRRWMGRLQRETTDAETAAGLLEAVYGTDGVAAFRALRIPTLFLHRQGDRAIPFELGRRAAALVRGSEFQPLPGSSHAPYFGQAEPLLEAILGFLRRPAEPSPLTDRELAVAALVARGLTSAEIASELGVAVRTADAHVEHIRNKLGVRSRAQIATWATRRGA